MASNPTFPFPWLLKTVFALGLLGQAACDSRGACTLQRVYGVRVRVVRGADMPTGGDGGQGGAEGSAQAGTGQTGDPGGAAATSTCLATVQATDGSYSETLKCEVEDLDCICVGLTEIPGTFDVTATLGSRRETQSVTVRPEGCSVSTKQLTFFDE